MPGWENHRQIFALCGTTAMTDSTATRPKRRDRQNALTCYYRLATVFV
jgi:hypothetical protein